MTKEMTVSELKKHGFDIDSNAWMDDTAAAVFHGEDVESYLENDPDALKEIAQYENPVLELIAHFENGIVTGFAYAYGPRIEEVGAHNDDDLNGVIDWLRR